MRNVRRFQVVTSVAALSVMLVSGCSQGSSTAATSTTSPPSDPASATTGASPSDPAAASGTPSSGAANAMSMRVVNLFDPKNVAGPALDIYDVQLTGQAATPVVTNLAYGAVSTYFTPQVQSTSSVVQLFALPAGEDPVAKMADAQNISGAQDDGSHPQMTWVLTADTGDSIGGPLAGLSFSSRVEKGTNNGSSAPVAPPPPAGQGEILADTSAVFGVHAGFYLMIDASCDEPLNGDKQEGHVPYAFAADGVAPVSSFAVFATSPGTHQVSVVAWTSSTAPTCAQLTAKQGTTSVQVGAGQQIEAYLYGTSATDTHIAFAPIQQ
ncbi:MAG TPA: hypothetical protein VIC82_08035 [Candidatus Nanopelagicales bacterium]|jgi:hypothetical protein